MKTKLHSDIRKRTLSVMVHMMFLSTIIINQLFTFKIFDNLNKTIRINLNHRFSVGKPLSISKMRVPSRETPSNFNWINQSIFHNLHFKTDFSNCSLCKYPNNTNHKSNSSPRDLIMGLVYGTFPYNILTLARSIRSTGCNATIVYFICENVTKIINAEYSNELINCGVTVIKIPSFGVRTNGIHGNLLRHKFFSLFLDVYEYMFDRVILLDLYDTYFQLDPFTNEFDEDHVIFSQENMTIDRNEANTNWLKSLDPDYSPEKYKGKRPICSGLFYGTVQNILTLYSMFQDFERWTWIGKKAQDQGPFNEMFYNKKFKDLVQPETKRLIVSATGHVFKNLPNDKEFVMYSDGVIPYVIHQYDRKKESYTFPRDHCPSLGKWHMLTYAKYNWVIFKKC